MTASLGFDAPLGEDVRCALEELQAVCKELRPVPKHLAAEADADRDALKRSTRDRLEGSTTTKKADEQPASDDPAAAGTADEYFAAIALPEHLSLDALQGDKHRLRTGQGQHIARLSAWARKVHHWISISDQVSGDVRTLQKKLVSLVEINGAVKQQSTFLSSQASSLITTSESCQALCNGIEERLQNFATVDRLSNEFGSASLNPTSVRFQELLKEMDATAAFLSANLHFKSAAQYLSRMHITQQKAMVLMRDRCIAAINKVTRSVAEDARFIEIVKRTQKENRWYSFLRSVSTAPAPPVPTTPEGPSAPASFSSDPRPVGAGVPADVLNASSPPSLGSFGLGSILSVEFQAKLNDAIPLFTSLQARCQREDTKVFLQDVVHSYVQARLSLLTPVFLDYLAPHLQPKRRTSGGKLPQADTHALERMGSTMSLTSLTSSVNPLAYAKGVAPEEMREMLNEMIAHGTTYLLALATDEQQLFQSVWQNPQAAGEVKEIVDSVALVLYDAFRATVVQEDDMGTLCSIIHTMNSTVLSRLQAAEGPGELIASTLSRMCQDAQERLTFRSQVFIKDTIRPSSFSADDVLPYTHKAAAPPSEPETAASSPATPNDEDGQLLAPRPQQRAGGAAARMDKPSPYFPALQNTLDLLASLYPVLDKGVFASLAQEAIGACMHTLAQAAAVVRAVPRAVLPLPELDSKLFLVMHLLQLREQITPFEVSFQVVEKHVDFSNIRRRELSIAATQHDTKKDLESVLKQVCEQFIASASQQTSGSFVRFAKLLKSRTRDPFTATQSLENLLETVIGGIQAAAEASAATPSRVPKQPQGEDDTVPAGAMLDLLPDESADAAQLTEEEAAEQAKKKSDIEKGEQLLKQATQEYELVLHQFEHSIPILVRKMRFYLSNQFTMGILFKPVRGNAIEVCRGQ
ncbi:Conserved oligomeric Golgi complex subunit 3 [Diplonema papillatum]|nr:Conserved oligomeric Golgi complex subunit 3 [Diplonema papillatum]